MIKPTNHYGDNIIHRLLAEDILDKADISDMDIEIFSLRYGQDWYFEDIGKHIGLKYRNKAYTEGAMRYRTKMIRATIKEFLDKMDRLENDLR